MTCRLNVSVEWKSLLPLWWRVSFCFGRHLGSGHSVSHFILSAWSVSNASLIWERASGRKNVLRKLLCIRRAGFSVCWLYLFVSFWESSDWDWMKYTRWERLLLIKPFFSSALMFLQQKIFARLTSLFLPLFAFETAWEVFLFKTVGHVIDRDIYSEIEHIWYVFPLAAWWSFRHAKLTAGGGAQARILAIEFVWFFSFFLSFFLFFFFSLLLLAFLSPLPLPLLS